METLTQSKPGRLILKAVLTLLLLFLPLVPIWLEPVVPHPVPSLHWLSIGRVLYVGLLRMVGVRYLWTWYSYAIFLALIVLVIAVWTVHKGKKGR